METKQSQAYKNYTQKCPIKNVQSLSLGFRANKTPRETVDETAKEATSLVFKNELSIPFKNAKKSIRHKLLER